MRDINSFGLATGTVICLWCKTSPGTVPISIGSVHVNLRSCERCLERIPKVQCWFGDCEEVVDYKSPPSVPTVCSSCKHSYCIGHISRCTCSKDFCSACILQHRCRCGVMKCAPPMESYRVCRMCRNISQYRSFK